MPSIAFFDVESPAAEEAALGDDDAAGLVVGQLDLGGDGVVNALDVGESVLHRPGHATAHGRRRAAPSRSGRPATDRTNRSTRQSSSGKTWLRTASRFKTAWSSFNISRFVRRASALRPHRQREAWDGARAWCRHHFTRCADGSCLIDNSTHSGADHSFHEPGSAPSLRPRSASETIVSFMNAPSTGGRQSSGIATTRTSMSASYFRFT